jgi:hypothetical protein
MVSKSDFTLRFPKDLHKELQSLLIQRNQFLSDRIQEIASTRVQVNAKNLQYRLSETAERHLYMKVPTASPHAINQFRNQVILNYMNSQKTGGITVYEGDDKIAGLVRSRFDESGTKLVSEINPILQTIDAGNILKQSSSPAPRLEEKTNSLKRVYFDQIKDR